MAELYDKIQETVDFLKQRIGAARPKIAIILGSGLGALGDQIEDAVAIPYAEIPNFPSSDVKGHKNRLIVGRLEDKEVIALQGRFHFYEGYTMEQCTFPVRIFKGLGVEALFVSNAAGGLNPSFEVSDLMLIEDVINLTGTNPLRGPNDDRLGTRFPDMLNLFDAGLQKIAAELADERGFALRRGVYTALSGPTYETRAEVRMLRTLGTDAVGMSTVPEVMVARHAGIPRVLGISCITNVETGEVPPADAGPAEDVNHQAVLDAAKKAEERFVGLVRGVIAKMEL